MKCKCNHGKPEEIDCAECGAILVAMPKELFEGVKAELEELLQIIHTTNVDGV